MKIAVLISGEPRFGRDLTKFIEQIKGATQVDWYFWLWKTSARELSRGIDIVADGWLDIDLQWARDKIQANLPSGHAIARLELGRHEDWPPPEIANKAQETSLHRCWGMYSSLYQTDLLRRLAEDTQGKYDLVVRARPDAYLSKELNCHEIHRLLSTRPNAVITGNDNIHGYGHRINDMFAVGLSDTMRVYCDTVNCIPEFMTRGVKFHPETLLAYQLADKGVENIVGDFRVLLRTTGATVNGVYVTHFDSWA